MDRRSGMDPFRAQVQQHVMVSQHLSLDTGDIMGTLPMPCRKGDKVSPIIISVDTTIGALPICATYRRTHLRPASQLLHHRPPFCLYRLHCTPKGSHIAPDYKQETHLWHLLCIVLAYAESLLLSTLGLNNHFGQFAFTIAYAILLFIGGVTHPNSHVHPIVENIGKYHSGNIYYFHILIDNLFQSFGVFVPATQAILVFVVAWMLSIVLRQMQRITSGKKL